MAQAPCSQAAAPAAPHPCLPSLPLPSAQLGFRNHPWRHSRPLAPGGPHPCLLRDSSWDRSDSSCEPVTCLQGCPSSQGPASAPLQLRLSQLLSHLMVPVTAVCTVHGAPTWRSRPGLRPLLSWTRSASSPPSQPFPRAPKGSVGPLLRAPFLFLPSASGPLSDAPSQEQAFHSRVHGSLISPGSQLRPPSQLLDEGRCLTRRRQQHPAGWCPHLQSPPLPPDCRPLPMAVTGPCGPPRLPASEGLRRCSRPQQHQLTRL